MEGITHTAAKNPARSALRKILAVACAGLFLAETTGCTITSGMCRALDQSECIDDFMIGYRNRALAEKAWFCRQDRFHDHTYGKEFKDGFIDGYLAVAQGGDGCIPSVAPSKYWGWKYQSAKGQSAINAYFQGYPLGVKAAEQDGVGHWQQIRTYNLPSPAPMMPVDEAGVSNPFYPEEEMVPAPVPEALPPQWEGDFDGPVILDSPDSAASDAPSPAWTMETSSEIPELIARVPETSDSSSVAASMDDQAVQLNAPTEANGATELNGFGPLGDSPEGEGAAAAQTTLPFTFE